MGTEGAIQVCRWMQKGQFRYMSGYKRGKLGMDIFKIYSIHVLNCQRINKKIFSNLFFLESGSYFVVLASPEQAT